MRLLTSGRQQRVVYELVARHGAALGQSAILPATATDNSAVLESHAESLYLVVAERADVDLTVRGPNQLARPVALAVRPIALVHASVRPRVGAQTATLAADEAALVVSFGKDQLDTLKNEARVCRAISQTERISRVRLR